MNDALICFKANPAGRDFVVGDIHGHFDVLERLLEHIGFDRQADRLFSVGDLIDRGPQSERAVEFLDQPWFESIRGNHEQMLVDALTPGLRQPAALNLWHTNGGDWFEHVPDANRLGLFKALGQLPLAMEIETADGGTAALVHADMHADDWQMLRIALGDPGRRDTLAETLLWRRDRARLVQDRMTQERPVGHVAVAGVSVVFFGHTPMPMAMACDNTRWIDTGVFMPGGRLTVAELTAEGAVWSLGVRDGVVHTDWRQVVSGSAAPSPGAPAQTQAAPRTKRRSRWLPWRR